MAAVNADPFPRCFVGWDVGGWDCDHNPRSRDAIVILNADLRIVGGPWRGNLRRAINAARTPRQWLKALFTHCQADLPAGRLHATMAIDTPLGFSVGFTRLVTGRGHRGPVGPSQDNPYLYREAERMLIAHGLRPLSPLKDMIGSQATKGMHVIAKFTPEAKQCGVWSDGALLTAIEAYPSPCGRSVVIGGLLDRYRAGEPNGAAANWIPAIDHPDKRDALICALVAYLFSTDPQALVPPPVAIPPGEGWIWLPRDALPPDA
ncbi:MAG: hypothetical protein ACP5G2_06275 [Candidatus Bipolaricaulaceae bacterium]